MSICRYGNRWRAFGWDTAGQRTVHVGMFDTKREALRAEAQWKAANKATRRKATPRERGIHTLYRCFDGMGLLVYVGAAGSRLDRLVQHERKDWWPTVSRIELEHYANREDALVAEAHAIAAERPLHNRSLDRSLLSLPKPEPASSPSPPTRTASEAELIVAQVRELVNGKET